MQGYCLHEKVKQHQFQIYESMSYVQTEGYFTNGVSQKHGLIHFTLPWLPHSLIPTPRPLNLKIIQSQWTASPCVKVMFGLAGNQLEPANQHTRTKCFCLHLEYLKAAELPHVSQREIEKKRVVGRRKRTETKTGFGVCIFTKNLKNINVFNTETGFLCNVRLETGTWARNTGKMKVEKLMRVKVFTDNVICSDSMMPLTLTTNQSHYGFMYPWKKKKLSSLSSFRGMRGVSTFHENRP